MEYNVRAIGYFETSGPYSSICRKIIDARYLEVCLYIEDKQDDIHISDNTVLACASLIESAFLSQTMP